MYLDHKTDKEIEKAVCRIATQEFELVVESVLHLCQLVKRNLHLKGRHSSLFSYLCEIGYSRDQALVRKDAVLLLVELPELVHSFINREFSISTLHHMRQVFRREQRRRSKEKLERLTHERKLEVAKHLSRLSIRDTRRHLAEEFPESHKSDEKTRPLAEGKTEITFSCTSSELKDFEELKDIWGHKNHERSWQVLFADLAFEALKRHRATMTKPIDMHKVGTPQPLPYDLARTRYRNVHVERLVRNRASDRCEHTDPDTGARCEGTHALEVDHIIPLAQGGADHPDNMRLLCGPHNRYAAWKRGLTRPKVDRA